jgi:AcrR family transcriptional regulator
MTQHLEREKREPTEDRRLEIARAARALIIEKGFEGLRTRDIAERVGINIATLHYHVPTKAALISMVADSMRQDFIAQSQRRPRQHLAPFEQLRLEFDDFRETMTETPELAVLFAELLQRARRDDNVAAVMAPLHAAWIGIMADIFRRGVADGSFRADLDPMAAARLTTGALGDFWRRDTDRLDAFDALVAELERAVVNPFSPSKTNRSSPQGEI